MRGSRRGEGFEKRYTQSRKMLARGKGWDNYYESDNPKDINTTS
jgi:hypothetical protein